MNRVILLFSAMAAALFCSGCSFNAGYNPSYLPAKAMPLGISGKSAVVMESTDAQWVFSGGPSSFTGGGTTLSVPIGEITKQVALKVFGAACTDGADFREKAQNLSAYRVVVQPKVGQFTYAYNQLKNLGFAVTPQVTVQLNVVLLAPDGSKLLEKQFSSGTVDGDTYMLSGQPAEKVNQLLHQVLFKLMTDAAMEAKGLLEKAAPVAA
jgi:hypothetical protein